MSRLRDEIYNTANREKTARAEEFSAIKRGVSRDNVVIADAPNYIKGYRYQLWCEAKAASTRCCVVHVAAQEDECRRWNEERLRTYDRGEEIGLQSIDQHSTGPKSGKNVKGDLVPESHTAIYGDQLPTQPSRSRSSSLDASEGAESRPQADDTMTLKSLYISSPNTTSSTRALVPNGAPTEPADTYLPAIQPPAAATVPPYSPTTLTSLAMRYEPPSPFTRWDTPLFTVPTSDAHPPYAAIFDAVFPAPSKSTSKKALSQLPASSRSLATSAAGADGTATSATAPQHPPPPAESNTTIDVKPHAATLLPTQTSSSALQLLESSTLLVVRALLPAARLAGAADGDGGVVSFIIPVAEEREYTLDVPQGMRLTQPSLQQLRRKYTQLQRGRIAHGQGYAGSGGGGRGEVVDGFVRFLEGEFGGAGEEG